MKIERQCCPSVIRPYTTSDANSWDKLVAVASGGTVLHSRQFLDYHGTRFADHSLVWWDDRAGEPVAVMPLAASLKEPSLAISHPGSSFGGIISRDTDSQRSEVRLHQAATMLQARGFDRVQLRLAPSILLRRPDDVLLPVLMRLGRVTGVDLWSVLRLERLDEVAGFLKRQIRRGLSRGLTAAPVEAPADWACAHALIAARLQQKYGVEPVHSVTELIDLDARLGRQSRGMLIRDENGTEVAAFWCIDYGNGTLHNQYIAASDSGQKLHASAFGLATLVEDAAAEGFRQFSFGRSTEADGWRANQTLQKFKANFGAGLAAQFNIEIELDRLVSGPMELVGK